jgi:carotenoid cleavage dioxygenase
MNKKINNQLINNDVKKIIDVKLSLKNKKIIEKISGFYGLIGPNFSMDNNLDNLYDLFTGDGVIQGVFFEKGELTFVKHFVRTEKLEYEEKNGKITNNILVRIILMILNKLNLFPNMMGMANTAIINIKNNNYALFERDYPYLININFQEKEINTCEKIYSINFQHFSGHSKVINEKNIETIEYKIYNKIVNYYLLNKDFSIIDKIKIKFNYVPIIHDFYSINNSLILIESPLIYEISNIFKKKIPIILNNKKETFIHIINRKTKQKTTYVYEKGVYIFHYALIKETKDTFEIYGSQYDDLSFSNIDLKGNYRMIEINKKNKKVIVHKNKNLEKYNLDFPIIYKDKVISRNYENRRINGFIITKDLEIVKILFYENKYICGEHNIIYIDKIPYLIFFNVEKILDNKSRNLLTLVNLINYSKIDIDIEEPLNIGFHSIFIRKL